MDKWPIPKEKTPMLAKSYRKSIIPILAVITVLYLSLAVSAGAQGFPGGHHQSWGPNYSHAPLMSQPPQRCGPPGGVDPLGRIRYWNEIMLNANALDHTPVASGETRVFGEQLGPGRTARAFAIVHIAIFDAVNAIAGGYKSYTGFAFPGFASAHSGASLDAAIAQAAHDTLAALYPSQAPGFDDLLAEDLSKIPDGFAKAKGIIFGKGAAAAILANRANDGSEKEDPLIGIDYIPNPAPRFWHQDPISQVPIALGAFWGEVKPFVLRSSSQFRTPSPPFLAGPNFMTALNEVKRVGGDGLTTPTKRTREQTRAGIYWAYDGTPGLGTPPRLYNQITVQIAEQKGSDAVELARLLALVNVAMADAGIACWEMKYIYKFARPITYIRETGIDVTWTPLGAPASNFAGPNFTPPFPAYASGHATFGAAVFTTLRKFYHTDHIPFTFISDELNGVTRDNLGNVRPLVPRTFSSLSQAMEENGQSRIYLGIHWMFDKTQGITQGQRVANYVFENVFEPQH
jgi:hypothetical protein